MGAPRFDPPDPEGHHDDLTTDELDGLTLSVPDDPRDLDPDRAQWLAEQTTSDTSVRRGRADRRRSTRPARSAPSRRSRLTLTAAVLVVSMVVVAVSGAVGAFFIPDSTPPPTQAPLSNSNASPGQLGALVPDAVLAANGAPLAARSLRPAVIALLPDSCADCTAWLTEVRRQTAEFGLDVSLVVGPDQAASGAGIEAALDSVRIDLILDPTDAFATAYQPSGRTLVLVQDDGIVANILRNPALDLRIESALLPLSQDLLDRA